MTWDNHKNFAISTVATAPSPATSGTSLVVASGEGTLFPAGQFNAVAWPATDPNPTAANAEIVRVTARSTDTFTITRAQESTSAKSIAVGWNIALVLSVKVITDLETTIDAVAAGVVSGYQPLDSDLSAIAALSTTSYGRSLLEAANAAAALTTLGAIAASLVDAKGDLLVGTADNTLARLAVGTNGYVPVADSSQATGIRWASAAPGGVGSDWDAIITKAATESVASSTALQDDDELLFASVSGAYYEFEATIIYDSPSGGSTPDIKFNFCEDATTRGQFLHTGFSTADALSSTENVVSTSTSVSRGTGTTPRLIMVRGVYGPANGGTFRLQWAQATSNVGATRVVAGSTLRARRIV